MDGFLISPPPGHRMPVPGHLALLHDECMGDAADVVFTLVFLGDAPVDGHRVRHLVAHFLDERLDGGQFLVADPDDFHTAIGELFL